MVNYIYPIPNKLLNLTDRDLKRELKTQNRIGSKWVERRGVIHEVVFSNAKDVILLPYRENSDGDRLVLESKNAKRNYYDPISYDDILKLKLDKIKYLSIKNISLQSIAKWFERTLRLYYDESNFDVTTNIEHEIINIVILFPEITITNSIELSHTIKDVYLRFQFKKDYDGLYLYGKDLARTSYSVSEIYNNYIFSHVSSRGCQKYTDSFCFGDTQLNIFMQRCSHNYMNPLQYFHSLLFNFEEYLKWESIEGVPYVYMDKVYNNIPGTKKCILPHLSQEEINQYANVVIDSIDNFEFRYGVVDGEISIIPSESFLNTINEILNPICKDEYKFLFVNGESRVSDIGSVSKAISYHGKKTQVVFKGETKLVNVYDKDEFLENMKNVNYPMLMHVDITKTVADFILEKFKNFIINKKLNG